jgi:hypothetical protein
LRAFRHFCEISRGSVWIVQCRWLHIAADKDQVGTERLHHIKLALCAIEVAAAKRGRRGLKIAKGLEDSDSNTQGSRNIPHFPRGTAESEKVTFEDFNAIKANCCCRL